MLSGKVFSTCSVKAVKQGEHSGWAVVLTDIVIAGLYICQHQFQGKSCLSMGEGVPLDWDRLFIKCFLDALAPLDFKLSVLVGLRFTFCSLVSA